MTMWCCCCGTHDNGVLLPWHSWQSGAAAVALMTIWCCCCGTHGNVVLLLRQLWQWCACAVTHVPMWCCSCSTHDNTVLRRHYGNEWSWKHVELGVSHCRSRVAGLHQGLGTPHCDGSHSGSAALPWPVSQKDKPFVVSGDFCKKVDCLALPCICVVAS